MSYRQTEMAAMIALHPDRARKMLALELRRAAGNVCVAARAMGVDRRTFVRWIARLDLDLITMRACVPAAAREREASARARRGAAVRWGVADE